MCRLFHEDNNHQRLLCTYLGSGTEWIEDSFVNRKRAAQKKAGDAKKGGEKSKGQRTTKVKTGA
mgnify:CR=1 FL=1